MQQIDIAILILIGLGALQGLFKGFILSITSLLGLVLGFYLSLRFAWYIEAILRNASGSDSPYMHIAAFVLCFLLVIIVVYIIGKSVEKIVEMASLGFVNRLAGAVLGIFKAMVLVSAIIYVLAIADRQSVLITPEAKQKSLFYEPMAAFIPYLVPQVKKGIERLKENTNKAVPTVTN